MLLLLLPTPPSVLLSVGRDGGNGSSASACRSGSIASDGRPSCSAHSARSLSSAARAAGVSGCDGEVRPPRSSFAAAVGRSSSRCCRAAMASARGSRVTCLDGEAASCGGTSAVSSSGSGSVTSSSSLL